MPSPFPGMDPYLEGEGWFNFRSQLLYEFARELVPQIRPAFFAHYEERAIRTERKHQFTLGIYRTPGRQLVTRIEILNPWNKQERGRDEYLGTRREWLQSNVHLLEVDLLRSGERTVLDLPPSSYVVLLSRATARPRLAAWPITLRDRLPTIPVPLLPEAADVILNLQRALTTVYDVCGLDLSCNYSRPAKVPLSPEDAAWAEERIRVWQSTRKS